MRISDWSSDVCSSDLVALVFAQEVLAFLVHGREAGPHALEHGCSRGGVVRVHVDRDEVYFLGFAVVGDDAGGTLPRYVFASASDLDQDACAELGRASCRARV